MPDTYPRIGHLRDAAQLRSRLRELELALPVDDGIQSAADGSPLAQPLMVGAADGAATSRRIGNRWCIHPMEGWDGTPDGRPTEHTVRRWRHFGESGAKLIWGGEAFAVRHDGRANPNQLFHRPENEMPLGELLTALLDAHREATGSTDDLLVGLQLTHSGRFSRPNDKQRLEPRIAYHHPLLDAKFGIAPDNDAPLLSDDEIRRIIDAYITSAKMADRLGFHFVDVKHCHGYLGHEFLSAFERPGPYGGDFAGRTRFLREICQGIRAACPHLLIGVRLSAFDCCPFTPDPTRGDAKRGKLGPGIPDPGYEKLAREGRYPGFGCRRDDPLTIDLHEPIRLLRMMRDELDVAMVNVSAGSPYYVPHIQRPAYFPPSDGYQPPEDPLVGCVRQIDVVRQLKAAAPELPLVGTAYTYFQEYLPHVAQAVVREGWVDSVGVGRMVLSYPRLPLDCLEHGEPRGAKLICRTFSDCTTAPRSGLISGCFPLDDHYKKSSAAAQLKQAKQQLATKLTRR